MRILTGLQPSGVLHWGNYFGAMKNAFAMQDAGEELFIFIANYHAMTTIRSGENLRRNTFGLAIDYLACGLDPEKSVFYRQSDVPEVQELAWFLSCVCPMGLLERCHSYKDKMAHGFEASHGLFAYPALMAADILIMNADRVPVGKDQKQHLEVARDLAGKFNLAYGEIFKLPEPYIPDSVAIIPGTDGQKMSKSYGNTIEIFESPKTLKKKLAGIKTDSTPLEAPKTPEGNAVWEAYKLFATPAEVEEMAAKLRAGGYGWGHAKKDLQNAVERMFGPMAEKRAKLEADSDYVEDVLREGGRKARKHAEVIMSKVRHAVGL